jgi:hypothetical protein
MVLSLQPVAASGIAEAEEAVTAPGPPPRIGAISYVLCILQRSLACEFVSPLVVCMVTSLTTTMVLTGPLMVTQAACFSDIP